MVCREIPVRPEERNIDVGVLVARHLDDELAGDCPERHAEMTVTEWVKDIVHSRRAADHGQGVQCRRSGTHPAARIGSSKMRGTSFNMPGVPSGGLEESPMLPEFP